MEKGGGLPFRKLIYGGVFLTGMTGLVYQICWQKYLSYLVGSEARSIGLVVGIFLFGLATGYFFWGKLTAQGYSRRQILKAYAFAEIAIGAYAILFPRFFQGVQALSYATPQWLVLDILITGLLLFIPTFCMGGTVPLLTAVLPEKEEEVNPFHSRLYGVNTLGATLGTFLTPFLFIPQWGLSLTLVLGGFVNLGVGVIFLALAPEGPVKKTAPLPQVAHQLSSWVLFLLVAVSGAVSIGLEILLVRAVGLSIGMSYMVFPLVVGLFILGLGLGGLSLSRSSRSFSLDDLLREFALIIFFLGLLFLVVPYWPYWLSNLRVRLVSIQENYGLYYFLVFLNVGLWVLPPLFSFGRLLPLCYALLHKSGEDFGDQCGKLYFSNTLGTLFGSLFLGYLGLNFFNLDDLFRISVLFLCGFFVFLLIRLKRITLGSSLAILLSVIFLFKPWPRDNHAVGLFRKVVRDHESFVGLLQTPKIKDQYKTLFFKDDPNTSVAVIEDHIGIRSIMVNGKSDGSTKGADLMTVVMLALRPYLFYPGAVPASGLSSTVIGLGTGITAGVLAQIPEVRKVKVLEISSAVGEANRLFSPYNYSALKNPKVEVEEVDAFRYFFRGKNKSDLIISEPSNPWVMGVENLYTREFYDYVNGGLNPGGVFVQWMHVYSMDEKVLQAVIQNFTEKFPYVELSYANRVDILLMGSHRPLHSGYLKERMKKEKVAEILSRVSLNHPEQIILMQYLEGKSLHLLGTQLDNFPHSLDFPWLGMAAHKSFFLQQDLQITQLLNRGLERSLMASTEKMMSDAFISLVGNYPQGIPECTIGPIEAGLDYICLRLKDLYLHYAKFRTPSFTPFLEAGVARGGGRASGAKLTRPIVPPHQEELLDREKIFSYGFLRSERVIPKNEPFLDDLYRNLLGRKKYGGAHVPDYFFPVVLIQEFMKEGLTEKALSNTEVLEKEGLINAHQKGVILGFKDQMNQKEELFKKLNL